jgi:hypothetical protein
LLLAVLREGYRGCCKGEERRRCLDRGLRDVLERKRLIKRKQKTNSLRPHAKLFFLQKLRNEINPLYARKGGC